MSKSPTLRRIQADMRELALDPSDRYHAAPLESSMLEWHFTICGADETDFAGGIYHGRIVLPPDYPFKPPHILFLTPTGRFETHTKICLSFSAFHPELWQPAWGIRLILEALISFLPTPADGAIGALDWSAAERRKLAAQSVHFVCPTCQCCVKDLIPKLHCQTITSSSSSTTTGSSDAASSAAAVADGTVNKAPKSRFQKEIEELQRLQFLQHSKKETNKVSDDDDRTTGATPPDTTTPPPTCTPSATTLANEEDTDDPETQRTAAAVTCGPVTVTDPVLTPTPVTLSNLSNTTDIQREGTTATTTTTTTTTTTPSRASHKLPRVGLDEMPLPSMDAPTTTTNGDVTTPTVAAPAASTLVPVPPATTVTTTTTGTTVTATGSTPSLTQSVWVDPLLHGIIAVLSVLVYLWLHKVLALVRDIREAVVE